MTHATSAQHPKAKNLFADAWHGLIKNKMAVVGACVLLFFIFVAIFADFIAPYRPMPRTGITSWSRPAASFCLAPTATAAVCSPDIVYGSRISLLVGFIAVAFSAIGGGIIGACAGYFRGGLTNVPHAPDGCAAGHSQHSAGHRHCQHPRAQPAQRHDRRRPVHHAFVCAHRARGGALHPRQRVHRAAVAIGDSTPAIILHNILPNCMAPIIVQATLGVASAILSAAGLSFLGLGLQPPSPEWGAMLSEGRAYIYNAPWLTICPGVSIVLIVLSLNPLWRRPARRPGPQAQAVRCRGEIPIWKRTRPIPSCRSAICMCTT